MTQRQQQNTSSRDGGCGQETTKADPGTALVLAWRRPDVPNLEPVDHAMTAMWLAWRARGCAQRIGELS